MPFTQGRGGWWSEREKNCTLIAEVEQKPLFLFPELKNENLGT